LSYWFGVILLIMLLVYVFDAGHYLYISKRIDASITRFSSDLSISTSMLWQSYPVLQICLGIVVIWGLGYGFHSRLLLSSSILAKSQRSKNN